MLITSLALVSLGLFGAHVCDFYLQRKTVAVHNYRRRNLGIR